MHNEKNYLEIYFENEFIPHTIFRWEDKSTSTTEYLLDNEDHEKICFHSDKGWILSS